MTAHEPTIRSVFVPDGDQRSPIGLHLEMLSDEIQELELQVRLAVHDRPEGTATVLKTAADELEQAAGRLLAAWREHFPARPASPAPPAVPVDLAAPLVAGTPRTGKAFRHRTEGGRVYLPGGRSFPIANIEITDAAPLPDAEGLAAAEPTPGDRTAKVMADLEEAMDAGRAARARYLRKGTRVRVAAGHPILAGVEAVVHRSGPDMLGRVSIEAVLPGYGPAIIDNLRRDDLVVPLQPGDRVAHESDGEVWRLAEVLPNGRLIVDDGTAAGERSGPWMPEGWERVE